MYPPPSPLSPSITLRPIVPLDLQRVSLVHASPPDAPLPQHSAGRSRFVRLEDSYYSVSIETARAYLREHRDIVVHGVSYPDDSYTPASSSDLVAIRIHLLDIPIDDRLPIKIGYVASRTNLRFVPNERHRILPSLNLFINVAYAYHVPDVRPFSSYLQDRETLTPFIAIYEDDTWEVITAALRRELDARLR